MKDDLIPNELLEKLDSDTISAVLRFNKAVKQILSDNKLPFFPNYTDHGQRHVVELLSTIVKHLIPHDALDRFTVADAAVLTCAAMLHDLAMHLRQDGFLQLITGNAPHKPIPWFDSGSAHRAPDLPWPEEWTNFRIEVARFSDRDFFLILGHLPNPDDLVYWLDEELPTDPSCWKTTDHLLIGEFVRRHHGRLAHEIAIFGFPGLGPENLPPLQDILPKLADMIGLVARSHSLPLREATSYLAYKHPKVIRPRDAVPIYHMALLRIGDYLQLHSARAPSILFKLRAPTVPPSVDAWNQHDAVADISYTLDDPVAIKIELSDKHSLVTHLQLEFLIEGLQRELDMSSAVLSETYGRVSENDINTMRLAKLRVYSNHNDRALLDRLPYIPQRIAFGADPKILSLMVEPIYGQFPEFAIRELVQNGVDAVLERMQYCATRKLAFDRPAADVVVELVENDGLVISISDVGIGMTPDIVRDYFLRAGASFRDNRRWKQEYINKEGATEVRRSGRFGVGVFAGFLLGSTMEVTTRHASSSHGCSFVATNGSELIELKRVEAPVGTTIKIRLSDEAAENFLQEAWPHCAHWYALEEPKVALRHRTSESINLLPQALTISAAEANGDTVDWNVFKPSGFAAISWTSNLDFGLPPMTEDEKRYRHLMTTTRKPKPLVFCNGFLIGAPKRSEDRARHSWERREVRPIEPSSYAWSEERAFSAPTLAISDHEGALPLTLRRDQLAGPLSFEDELAEDIVVDFLAWCIATAPVGPIWYPAFTPQYTSFYPLVRKGHTLDAPFRWLCSSSGVTPLDRSLLQRLDITSLLGVATVSTSDRNMRSDRDENKVSTTVGMSIEGGWPVLKPHRLDNVMAFHLGDTISSTTIFKEPEAISHQDFLSAMTECFVEYLGTARGNSEFSVRGAEILKVVEGSGATEEVRAGEYVKAKIELASLVEHTPKSTTYFAWGDERRSALLRARFIAELAIAPVGASGTPANAWSSIVGADVIPFDEKSRADLMRNACKSPSVAKRIEKWAAHVRSK